MKQHIIAVVVVLGIQIGAFANGYPWDKIQKVKITVNYQFQGLSLHKKNVCRCNCSGAEDSTTCTINVFKVDSWDYDTCFWKTLLTQSSPRFTENGLFGGLMCGEPELSIIIDVITATGDTLHSMLEKVDPRIISFSASNGRWDFQLDSNQTDRLSAKLKFMMKCGIDKLSKMLQQNTSCP